MASCGAADRAKAEKDGMWNEMDALARLVKPLDLGIGSPNFMPPEELMQDLRDTVTDDDVSLHQVTADFGHPPLLSALCALYSPVLGTQLRPVREVLVTNGASEALFVSIMGLVNPGDEVIIIEPYFDCYVPQVKMAGGTPVFISLKPPPEGTSSSADWALDPEELSAAFSSKTKAIVINTPHNPTGKVFSLSELEMIASLSRQYGAVVISDEVYEWFTYDDTEHIRIATLPGMWKRTITIASAGKTFFATGLKVGWMVGPEGLLQGPKAVLSLCGVNVTTPIQEALSRIIRRETQRRLAGSSDSYFNSLSLIGSEKRDRLVAILRRAGLTPIVPQGGYFMLVDVREVMRRVNVGGNPNECKDFQFVKWLSKNKKLQVIPPSAFFSQDHKSMAENYVRFCFMKDLATLDSVGPILGNLTSTGD